MPRKAPPPHPKGAPRTPGSGRRKGTPNRKTVEMQALVSALVNDVYYQSKLRQDFIRRRVHPSTEVRVWEYALGKPKESIELSADVTMNQRLAAERELLRELDVSDLERLVAESERLLDKALAEARERARSAAGGIVAFPSASDGTVEAKPPGQAAGSPANRCQSAPDNGTSREE